jgi:hypothetical protein
VDQRKKDQDRDGLRNRGEWLSDTNPRDRDSDDDGISDSKEKAGVISAYDAETGTLTLTVYAGGSITGQVDDSTRVKCEDDSADEEGSGDDSGSSGGDDSSGGEGSRSGSNRGPGAATVLHRGGGDSSDDDSPDDSQDDSSDDDSSDDSDSDDSSDDGEDHADDHSRGCDCSVDDLAEGVEVTEARLKFTADGLTFTRIEIVSPATATG